MYNLLVTVIILVICIALIQYFGFLKEVNESFTNQEGGGAASPGAFVQLAAKGVQDDHLTTNHTYSGWPWFWGTTYTPNLYVNPYVHFGYGTKFGRYGYGLSRYGIGGYGRTRRSWGPFRYWW